MACTNHTPKSPFQADPKFYQVMDEIIERTRCNGSIIISGTGGAGKSTFLKWFTRQIIKHPKFENNGYRTMVIDPLANFRFDFDEVPYVDMSLARYPPYEKALILDMNALSLAQKKLQFLKIFKDEFNEAKMQRVKDNGVVKVTTFFLSDEFHNILGRHSLDGEKGEEMKEILTTGRNAGLIFGGVVRRLADASTVFVESCNTYLFGLSGGDNDLRKIRNETDSKEVRDMVAGLRPRSFIFYDKERKAGFDIGMPDFYPVGKPYEIKVDYSRGYVKPFYL